MNKKLTLCISILCTLIGITGCSTSTDNNNSSEDSSNLSNAANESSTSQYPSDLDIANMFSNKDKEIGYDETTSINIELTETSATATSDNVKIDGSTVTISSEGVYVISGTLTNGQIIVDATQTDKIHIVLKDATINCDTSAAIYVKQADKVFLTLDKNSTNTLSNKGEFVAIDDNNIDSVIFSKDDLTINGEGSLIINANYGHGIVAKDDLVFAGGNYTITSAGHALSGKDSIRIASGDFNLTSEKDGLHSENTDDATVGFIYIADGSFNIDAKGDGIDAMTILQVDSGDFNITTGGGSSNAPAHTNSSNDKMNMFMGGNNTTTAETTTDTTSLKGLKSGGNLQVNGGTFSIDSEDDSLHSNSNVIINSGTLNLSSGDDGIHADTNTTINGGDISIDKCYEGIEGQSIDITGGNISLTSSDDGINSAGGNNEPNASAMPSKDSFNSNADCYIKISGGKIFVNASGDGVDSNGNLYVTGGETYVSGPTNNGNGALDYDGTAEITGGIFIATGASGMAQNFGSTSTQGSILYNSSNSQSGKISITDSNGKELASFTSEKQFNSVVVSAPGINKGDSYTLTVGNDTQTIEMTDIIYGNGGGMGGRPNGNMGGQPNGNMGERPNNKGNGEMVPPTNGNPPTSGATVNDKSKEVSQ